MPSTIPKAVAEDSLRHETQTFGATSRARAASRTVAPFLQSWFFFGRNFIERQNNGPAIRPIPTYNTSSSFQADRGSVAIRIANETGKDPIAPNKAAHQYDFPSGQSAPISAPTIRPHTQ